MVVVVVGGLEVYSTSDKNTLRPRNADEGSKLDGGSTAGPDKPIRAMTPPSSRDTAGVR